MDSHSPDEDSSVFTDIDASVVEVGRLVSTGAVKLDAVVVDVDGMWDHEEARVVRYVAVEEKTEVNVINLPFTYIFVCINNISPTLYRHYREQKIT